MRKIAKMCAVSPQMVSYMKREMDGNGKRVGTDPITPEPSPTDINDSEATDTKEVNGAGAQDPPSGQPSSESGDSSGGQVGHLESDSEFKEQDQPGIPAHEQGQNGAHEDVVDHEQKEEANGDNQDSPEDAKPENEENQPFSGQGDPPATTEASEDDAPCNPADSPQLEGNDEVSSVPRPYVGRLQIELPEVEANSEEEARNLMAEALALRLLEEQATIDMIKVSLKSDAPTGVNGTGEPEDNGDESIDSEVHLNMLAA